MSRWISRVRPLGPDRVSRAMRVGAEPGEHGIGNKRKGCFPVVIEERQIQLLDGALGLSRHCGET